MSTPATLERPSPALLDWLASHHVEYEVHAHSPTFTARATARAEGVDPRTFAKVVGVSSPDGRRHLVVLDATDHLDLSKAGEVIGSDDVRLLSEDELTALAPDCQAGALPAVGALFGLATYADYAVRDDTDISFNAGSHSFSVRVERAGWERACGVVYGDLASESDSRPAWARS
ncbi:MAG: YbaK/EbsC family protein [Chloroflexi bacterium]|nr:YbaK/EbsC family protein [Chloroflexota bacterium]